MKRSGWLCFQGRHKGLVRYHRFEHRVAELQAVTPRPADRFFHCPTTPALHRHPFELATRPLQFETPQRLHPLESIFRGLQFPLPSQARFGTQPVLADYSRSPAPESPRVLTLMSTVELAKAGESFRLLTVQRGRRYLSRDRSPVPASHDASLH